MKRVAAILAITLAVGWAVWTGGTVARALAADDALSIDANLKYLEDNKLKKGVIVRPSGLQFRILQNGFGKRPQSTDTVKVYYTGKLINGVVFDGTSPGLPASMKLNSVIPGWIEALQLMREGDRWEVIIPADMAYGEGSSGGVPPDQTLRFLLQLDHVEHLS